MYIYLGQSNVHKLWTQGYTYIWDILMYIHLGHPNVHIFGTPWCKYIWDILMYIHLKYSLYRPRLNLALQSLFWWNINEGRGRNSLMDGSPIFKNFTVDSAKSALYVVCNIYSSECVSVGFWCSLANSHLPKHTQT